MHFIKKHDFYQEKHHPIFKTLGFCATLKKTEKGICYANSKKRHGSRPRLLPRQQAKEVKK